MSPPRMAGTLARTLLKAAVSAGLLVWLFRGIDIGQVRSMLVALPISCVVAAAALILLQLPVLAYRWLSILNVLGDSPSLSTIWRATYVGIFFNQALPGSVGGDLLRILYLRRNGVSLRVSADSVLLERLTGLYALMLLLTALTPLVWPMLRDRDVVVATLGLTAFVTAAFVGLAFADRFVPAWQRLDGARSALAALREDYVAVLRDRRAVASLLVLGAISWSLNLLAIYVIARGAGIEVAIAACLFFAGLSVLLSVVPVSLAGWGVREGAMVTLLGLVGVPAEHAAAISVTAGILMLLTALPAGLLLVGNRALDFRRHR